MNIKDLRRNILKEKKELNFLWYKKDNPQLLLMDLRDRKTLKEELEWKHYNKQKLEGGEFFKILRLSMSFVDRKVSTRKTLSIFPYYKRGTKGYLLDTSVITILPKEIQLLVKKSMEEKGTNIILFNETIITLPPEYFRILKR